MNEVLITALFSIGFNLFMFIPAFIYKTDKLTDISYALTFFTVAIFSYFRSGRDIVHTILLTAILLWSIRLGSFLYMRILRMKRDRRFDDKRDNFFKFMGFWIIQGITVPVVMVSSILVFTSDTPALTVPSFIGLAVFGSGLLIEAVADSQKFKFSGDPTNKDKWIDSGIWSISRHPNYLGEIMVWSGLFLFGIASLSGVSAWVATISPVYITGLLLFVSGVPLLEKSADAKWGSDPKYQAYKKRTPVLVPFIGKK